MELVDWLKSLHGVIKAEPKTVLIYDVQYVAAYVEQQRYDNTTRRYFYLCGDLPKVYKRTSAVCFILPEDMREWYVSCYHNGVRRKGQENAAPFGACFLIEEWQQPYHIDKDMPKPYQRVFMTVTERSLEWDGCTATTHVPT